MKLAIGWILFPTKESRTAGCWGVNGNYGLRIGSKHTQTYTHTQRFDSRSSLWSVGEDRISLWRTNMLPMAYLTGSWQRVSRNKTSPSRWPKWICLIYRTCPKSQIPQLLWPQPSNRLFWCPELVAFENEIWIYCRLLFLPKNKLLRLDAYRLACFNFLGNSFCKYFRPICLTPNRSHTISVPLLSLSLSASPWSESHTRSFHRFRIDFHTSGIAIVLLLLFENYFWNVGPIDSMRLFGTDSSVPHTRHKHSPAFMNGC